MLAAPWRIELFGGLRLLQSDGRIITRFRTEKTGTLLAFLALFPRRAFPREVLAEQFWPDDGQEQGRHSLRQALSSLRRHLEPPAVSPGSVLATPVRGEVSLNSAAFSTDVADFHSALGIANNPATDQHARIQHLRRAAALYAGELLPGIYDEWALTERRALAEAHHHSPEELGRLLTEAGALEEALVVARRVTALDPFSGRAQSVLVHLLRQVGRNDAAVRESRLFFERLQEAGIDAAAELALLDQDVQRSVHRPAAAASAFSPVMKSPPNDACPLLSPAAHDVLLPPKLDRFFGRDREIMEIRDYLRPVSAGGCRLLTLTGPGGCGKTRLAIEALRDTDAYQGGEPIFVRFVSLADVNAASLIPKAIGRDIGSDASRRAESVEDIAKVLSSIPGGVVLVLDNFEQLAASGGSAFVERLLADTAAVRILVTSRRRLGIAGNGICPSIFCPFRAQTRRYRPDTWSASPAFSCL